MTPGAFPLLTSLILWPAFSAAALIFVRDRKSAKTAALLSSIVELLVSSMLLARFDFSSARPQFTERHSWIPSLDIDYAVGVDGLSVLFPFTTALLTCLVILASWTAIRSSQRFYYALLLSLEGLTVGVFCSLDLALFLAFWEMTLIPLYFLISLWGFGPQRRVAATHHMLLMLVGAACLSFAVILLAMNHASVNGLPLPSGLSFDVQTLVETEIASELQTTIFLLLVLGCAIRAPLFPFHTWLPLVAVEGPAGTAALLTGINLGLYGLLRVAIPLAPQAATRYAWVLAGLGIIGSVYGALLALRQTNLRRLLAYAGISHGGLVMVALSAMNFSGLQGALFQLVNLSLISGGLFLLAGFLQHRLASTELSNLGGLARSAPLLSTFVFVLGLAGIGLPGTNGFVAEFLMLLGIFESHTGLGIVALVTMILGSGYYFAFFRKAFLGTARMDASLSCADLRPRELIVVSILAGACLLLGCFPGSITGVTEASALAWVKRAGGVYPEQPSAFALIRHDVPRL